MRACVLLLLLLMIVWVAGAKPGPVTCPAQ